MKTVRRHNGWIVAAVATLSAFAYPVTGAMAEDGRFQKLSVYLERNVQDHDAEIRFEATGAEDGLAALKVFAPAERTVIDLKTPDSKLGIRSFTLIAQPADDTIVRADFPQGHIVLRTTTKGRACAARRDWPRIPKPAAFEYPRPDQKDMPATAHPARSVPRIESCAMLSSKPARPTKSGTAAGLSPSFTVPEGFLRAGKTKNSRSGPSQGR
jgi:hypothetical protein